MKFLKRFLDDLLSLWIGSPKQLHEFHEAINKIHPNIKITMNHTHPKKAQHINENCDCQPQESIPFLEQVLGLKRGK